MTRRSPTNRRGTLRGAGAAALALLAGGAGGAGAQKAAELDGELIHLLLQVRAQMRAPEPPRTDPPSLAEILVPPRWLAPLQAAAQMPARTPEGLRAKAEFCADWLAGNDRRTGPGRDCEGETAVAWSLLRDLLGEHALAPVPPLRRPITEEEVAVLRAAFPPPVVLPETPDVPWMWSNAARAIEALPVQGHALAVACTLEARRADLAGDDVRAHNLLMAASAAIEAERQALGIGVAWNTDVPRRSAGGEPRS
ncbi:hypothetical protein [Muricoccus radiodurans]|uniref:hypothetical protein n=1 Tax=Muricoccus radiodurans TaxID=2231721 RepID=UPI003CEC925B